MAGAALGASCMIVLGGRLAVLARYSGFTVPAAAFACGLLATLAVLALARHRGQTQTTTMLLAGIAVNTLAGAVTGLLIFMSSEETLRSLTFWTLGSFSGTTWGVVRQGAWFIPPSLAMMFYLRPALNLIACGEAQARSLGLSVERTKMAAVGAVTLAVGSSVAMVGMIGLIGLMVPHLLRLLAGPDHRLLVPGSVLMGAVLVSGADLVARTAAAPAELPIGILTAGIGAPFFIWLLLQQKRRGFAG